MSESSPSAPSAADLPGDAIRVSSLVHSYGDQRALRGVDFQVGRGEVLAVIGPNGAGKTTLLSILAGVREPDQGRVEVPGSGVSWVPQQLALYRRLTVRENLELFCRLEGVEDIEGRVTEMLGQTGLTSREDDPVSELSGGNQQRVNIAVGLLKKPSVLLLDEPSAGLDPRQRERLWEFVRSLAGTGTTVIFSSHHIHEAERYAGRLLVMAEGEVLFDGSAAELREASAAETGGDFESAFVSFLHERGH